MKTKQRITCFLLGAIVIVGYSTHMFGMWRIEKAKKAKQEMQKASKKKVGEEEKSLLEIKSFKWGKRSLQKSKLQQQQQKQLNSFIEQIKATNQLDKLKKLFSRSVTWARTLGQTYKKNYEKILDKTFSEKIKSFYWYKDYKNLENMFMAFLIDFPPDILPLEQYQEKKELYDSLVQEVEDHLNKIYKLPESKIKTWALKFADDNIRPNMKNALKMLLNEKEKITKLKNLQKNKQAFDKALFDKALKEMDKKFEEEEEEEKDDDEIYLKTLENLNFENLKNLFYAYKKSLKIINEDYVSNLKKIIQEKLFSLIKKDFENMMNLELLCDETISKFNLKTHKKNLTIWNNLIKNFGPKGRYNKSGKLISTLQLFNQNDFQIVSRYIKFRQTVVNKINKLKNLLFPSEKTSKKKKE